MAFAGVSLIAEGELCGLTASPIDAGADSGYHLLVVEGYWRSKGATPNGKYIKSRPFLVGGHRWHINYYPNGCKQEDDEEFISLYLVLDDDVEGQEVKAQAQAVFSFIDQPELRTSTRIRGTEISLYNQYLYGADQFIRRNILERSRHLKHDSFIIRCDIVVVKTPADDGTDKGAGSGSTASFVEMASSDMQSHLSDLLLSKQGADITFEVGGETFAAHRCVLAARSTVFKEQFFSGTTMTKENIVEINDIEPEIFKALLVYIYTDSFPDGDWFEKDESGKEKEEEETKSGKEEEEETESGEEEDEQETESGEEEEEDESGEEEDEEDESGEEEDEEDESGEEEDEEETESGEEEDEEETESGGEEDEEETESGGEEDEEETKSGEDEEYGDYVMWLLQLLEAADRYDLQRLKSICAEELVGYICRSRVANIIAVAERRQCPSLKDECVEFIKCHSSLYTVFTVESLDQIIKTCSPSVLKEFLFKFPPI